MLCWLVSSAVVLIFSFIIVNKVVTKLALGAEAASAARGLDLAVTASFSRMNLS